MALKIQKKPTPKHKNKFVVTAEWMHGDADGEAFTEYVYSHKDEVLVEECLNFLSSLEDIYSQDMHSDTLYPIVIDFPVLLEDIKKYHDKCRTEKINSTDEEDQIKDVLTDYFKIPSAATDDQHLCSFQDVKIKFYDADGIEHSVAQT